MERSPRWNGPTASPPAGLEFRRPAAKSRNIDAFWKKKQRERTASPAAEREREFEADRAAEDSSTGFITAFFCQFV